MQLVGPQRLGQNSDGEIGELLEDESKRVYFSHPSHRYSSVPRASKIEACIQYIRNQGYTVKTCSIESHTPRGQRLPPGSRIGPLLRPPRKPMDESNGSDVLDHGVKWDGYRALVGVVGLDCELSPQLSVRGSALESNRNPVLLARFDGFGGGDYRRR